MLRYRVEYAQSSRSKCGVCKKNILHEELRIGIKYKPKERYLYDWHHEVCFFKGRKRLGRLQDFEKFNTLKYEDQLRITDNLVDPFSEDVSSTSDILTEKEQAIFSYYNVEISKTDRAICRHCFVTIVKKEIRVSKLRYEENKGEIKYWYHLKCFSEIRHNLDFNLGGEHLPGYENLSENDKKLVKTSIRPKKIAIEKTEHCDKLTEVDRKNTVKSEFIENEHIDFNMKQNLQAISGYYQELCEAQNRMFHKYKSDLQTLSKSDLEILCKRNNLKMFKCKEEALDLLADCMAFGALGRCPKCRGFLQLKTFYYECTGFLSVWQLCKHRTKWPLRFPMSIPEELRLYPALQYYVPSVGIRIFANESEDESGPPTKRIKPNPAKPPLKNLQFYIYLKGDAKHNVRRRVLRLGGIVANKLVGTVAAVITTKAEMEKSSEFMEKVLLEGYHVVEESFLDKLESSPNMSVRDSIDYIQSCNISDTSTDIHSSIPREVLEGNVLRVSGDTYIFKGDQPELSKIKVKDGVPVVPIAEYEREFHVYKENGEPYSAALNRVDMNDGNICYTLQLLEADFSKVYLVVKLWGETGMKQQHTKTEFDDLKLAKDYFEEEFYKKTGNFWLNRLDFRKQHGKFDLVQMAEIQEAETNRELSLDTNSCLTESVQKLMILILNMNIINKTIAEIEIDTTKMPLGVPTDSQIETGYEILMCIYNALRNEHVDPDEIKELSNIFYTKIPHKGTLKQLKMLDSIQVIHEKLRMLNDLSNTRISYRLLKEEMIDSLSLMDQYYEKLKTHIEPLEPESDEYRIVLSYFTNTQSKHSSYRVHLDQIFKVEREGELEQFEPYSSRRKMLLWHGTKLSNIASILSKGLQIAPDGVQHGSMFGKAIYFADCVTKSAGYLYTTPEHPYGVILLCKVAVGNMKKCIEEQDIITPPDGIDSVWGVGRNQPDPCCVETLADGTIVPLGKIVPNTSDDNFVLVHNEYVVYNKAQVIIKYILQVHRSEYTE